MTLAERDFLEQRPELFTDETAFGRAIGQALKRRYPNFTAARVAQDLKISKKAAENILAGHLSARTITRLGRAYGLALLLDAWAICTDETLDAFIASKMESLRNEREAFETRERELARLRTAVLDRSSEARPWLW